MLARNSFFVWPFVHQRYPPDKYDPPLVQQRGNADGTMFGRWRSNHVVQPFKHNAADLRSHRSPDRRPCPFASINGGEHVDDLVLQDGVVFAVRPFALQPVVKI